MTAHIVEQMTPVTQRTEAEAWRILRAQKQLTAEQIRLLTARRVADTDPHGPGWRFIATFEGTEQVVCTIADADTNPNGNVDWNTSYIDGA